MGNRVEATYICPTHGPFSVIMATPPRHLDCPTCQRPSELSFCQTMPTGTTEDLQELMAHIQKIYSKAPRIRKDEPQRTEPQVLQDSLAIHESAQRAKMRAILDQLD